MKVLMMPNPLDADALAASGITAVLRDYARFAPEAGIEFVNHNAESFDVLAVHAGMSNFMTDAPYIAHCHGLYWTGDYRASAWEYKANRDVTSSLRRADVVTVPSEWVASTLRRDMHISPIVMPHAIDPSLWTPNPIERKYILWNKNRAGDVCNPTPVRELALRFPNLHFISTFAVANTPTNVLVTGSMPHSEMQEVVQSAHVYLSTTKETFGIGMLEARASGVPILAYREGGAVGIVQHGVDGYLAKPGDIDDLTNGLLYILAHHKILSENAYYNRGLHTWPDVMQHLHRIYSYTKLDRYKKGVSVVIPCYNYAHTLERAVDSVMQQELQPERIIIVDDGSTDNTTFVTSRLMEKYPDKIVGISGDNRGVAAARNAGMREVETEYACCLDADDEILPQFLQVCARTLDRDPELGLAYTRLSTVSPDGDIRLSEWPNTYNFSGFLKHQNQVPTCCVFRTEVFCRAGGYRSRYAPKGAGSEDANLWLRMGALGYGGRLASEEGLFHYHLGGRVSSDSSYREVDWLTPYPWTTDGQHPFASVAQSKGLSHDVYQYDTPEISIVIPCTPSHLTWLWDAVDSIEGQSFRYWEVIVVFDGDMSEYVDYPDFPRAFPFARIFHNQQSRGAGHARNLGAANAKGKYLLFLDADDWLEPTCLHKMYNAISVQQSVVYSDYIGHAVIDPAEAQKLRRGKRLLEYDENTQQASILHNSADYDCALAQRQPQDSKQFYIWNIITSLMPYSWYDQIGGFDEEMETWEDWDFWIRLAKLGKCFVRLEEPLVHYRFSTGGRREIGRQLYDEVIEYMVDKYKEIEIMPCSGCRGRTARITSNGKIMQSSQERMSSVASAGDSVLVELVDGNIAKHPISMRGGDGILVRYGYRQHGERFLMRRDHYDLYRNKFKLIAETPEQYAQDSGADEEEEEDDVELPAPTPLKVYTASDADQQVAVAERDERIRPKPAAKKKQTRRTRRVG